MSSRDWDILDDIAARLTATHEFDAVYTSNLPEVQGEAAGDRLAAVVQPASWEEVDDYDDVSDVQSTRRLRWTLTLLVRDDDAEIRERTLDRLLCVAQNALDGQSLASGLTIPDWTRLRRGQYNVATPPEQRMTVTGEVAYFIAGFAGHDTSP